MPECSNICNATVEMYNGQGFERGRVFWRRCPLFCDSPTGMKIIFKTGGWGGGNVLA
jgi:hypothetical protein